MITRRTTQRQYLLKNSRDGATKNDIGYLFALAATRTGQIVSGVLIMSNHYHAVMFDVAARRSKFMQCFHSLTGKVMNKRLQRRESLWSTHAPGDTLLLDTEAVVDALIYTWLNPVVAGLVDRVSEWDHFVILPQHWGKKMRFKRPDYFTDDSLPEYIEFTPMPPGGFEDTPETRTFFETRLREAEDEVLSKRGKKKSLGMKRCYRVSPFATPKKSEPMYKRNPRFKTRNKELASHAIACLRHFWNTYQACRRAFSRGFEVNFPSGTLNLREQFGVPCIDLLSVDPHAPRYGPLLN